MDFRRKPSFFSRGLLFHHSVVPFQLMERNTWGMSERLPKINCFGSGVIFIRVGVTIIPSASPRCGFLQEIDYFNPMVIRKVRETHRFQVRDRLNGVGRGARCVKNERKSSHWIITRHFPQATIPSML